MSPVPASVCSDDRQRHVLAHGHRLHAARRFGTASRKRRRTPSRSPSPHRRDLLAESFTYLLVGFIEPMMCRNSVDFPQPRATHDDHRVALHHLEGNAVEHLPSVEVADEIDHLDDRRVAASLIR